MDAIKRRPWHLKWKLEVLSALTCVAIGAAEVAGRGEGSRWGA